MPDHFTPEELARYANPDLLSPNELARGATPKQGPNWMRRVGLPTLGGGTAMDIGTTLAVLRQPGGREMNPLYGSHPSAGRLIGTSLATTLPLAVILDQLYKKSPPGSKARKIALATAMGAGGTMVGAGIHNLRELKK